jgi:hypothetical protein
VRRSRSAATPRSANDRETRPATERPDLAHHDRSRQAPVSRADRRFAIAVEGCWRDVEQALQVAICQAAKSGLADRAAAAKVSMKNDARVASTAE